MMLALKRSSLMSKRVFFPSLRSAWIGIGKRSCSAVNGGYGFVRSVHSWGKEGEELVAGRIGRQQIGILQQVQWVRGKKKKHRAAKTEPDLDSEGTTFDFDEFAPKADRAMAALERELARLRTGRPDPRMLDFVRVESYGEYMELPAVAQCSLKSPKLLVVNVFDANLTNKIKDAIEQAGLNLNPQVSGNAIQVPIPKLSKETREATVKQARELLVKTTNALNGVRRDSMKALADLKKKKIMTDDAHFDQTKIVEEKIGLYKKRATELVEAREKDILAKE